MGPLDIVIPAKFTVLVVLGAGVHAAVRENGDVEDVRSEQDIIACD